MKHKIKEMSVEDLIMRLKIEEDNKVTEKRTCGNSIISGAKYCNPLNKKKERKHQDNIKIILRRN